MWHLTETDIQRIDQTSLKILDEIGMRVDDDALRDQALAAGARPGRQADWITLPPEMVREYVAAAPSEARYADRTGNLTVMSPGAQPTFWTGAALEYITGRQSRAITAADLAEFTRLADAMPAVFAVVGTAVAEAPPPARDVVGLRLMAENTGKHLRPLLFSGANAAVLIEMAEVLCDGVPLVERPLLSFGYSCLSPLHWAQVNVDLWRGTAGHRLPVMLNGEPVTGATSPVTLAGAVALANAEILGGVVLVQLVEPGRPVVHNMGFAHVTDMRTAACLAGSAECALMAHAGARLAAHYGLPCASWMDTDSFCDDAQAGYEMALTGLAHVLGGVNCIWGMGQLQSQKALSPAQLVMDNDLAQGLLRYWRGFEVDDETLAYDVIRDVVVEGEQFMMHEHTMRHFREVNLEAPLLARTQRANWEAAGSTTWTERAEAKVQEILAEEPKVHVNDDQRRALERIELSVLSAL